LIHLQKHKSRPKYKSLIISFDYNSKSLKMHQNEAFLTAKSLKNRNFSLIFSSKSIEKPLFLSKNHPKRPLF